MNKWLLLSEGLYFFGVGGINRMEDSPHHERGYSEIHTALYIGQKRITTVKEPITRIKELLDESQSEE